jgi:hypothetical protein
MRDKEEQIKAILKGDTFHWALDQLVPGESIENKKYSDFVSVSVEDIYDYVMANGFPLNTVEELRKGEAGYYYDNLRIEEVENGWEVYGIERDRKSVIMLFPSLEEARKETLRRKIVSAKVELNHRYCLAHPELNLPKPSEME